MTQQPNRIVDESVHLTSPDPVWSEWVEQEISRLAKALTLPLSDFEHIGSTAVPELIAKPIIDIMLGVPAYPPTDQLSGQMQALGYEALGEAGVIGRLYFRRRSERSFNVSAVERNGSLWQRNVALRELLRADPSARDRYAKAKVSAIKAGHCTLLAYSASKSAIVAELIEEAMRRFGQGACSK